MLILPLEIPRMSGCDVPVLSEEWLEISGRSCELVRMELTVNIQLVSLTGLCSCYFVNRLKKNGLCFQISEA